jgi:hypothetical protein
MTAQARTTTDAPHILRDVMETSAAQANENFEKPSAAAGEATNLLKHSHAMNFKGAQDYSAKVLEFTNANISAAVEQATKLMGVKSPTARREERPLKLACTKRSDSTVSNRSTNI